MADTINGTQINKLPEATAISDGDILVVENTAKTQKIKVSTLKTQIDLMTDAEYAALLKLLQ